MPSKALADQGGDALDGYSGPDGNGASAGAMSRHAQRELVGLRVAPDSIIGSIHAVTPVLGLRVSALPRST